MNANSALALGFSALVASHCESHERAIEDAHKACSLSPIEDPLNISPLLCADAHAFFLLAITSSLSLRAILQFIAIRVLACPMRI